MSNFEFLKEEWPVLYKYSRDAEELSNDGAIHGAKLAVSELSALTATIGTLRTATSGARLEVHTTKIAVFDSNGNERVRLGNLS